MGVVIEKLSPCSKHSPAHQEDDCAGKKHPERDRFHAGFGNSFFASLGRTRFQEGRMGLHHVGGFLKVRSLGISWLLGMGHYFISWVRYSAFFFSRL